MKAKDKALLQAQLDACAAVRARHISRAVTQQAAQAAADRVLKQVRVEK